MHVITLNCECRQQLDGLPRLIADYEQDHLDSNPGLQTSTLTTKLLEVRQICQIYIIQSSETFVGYTYFKKAE